MNSSLLGSEHKASKCEVKNVGCSMVGERNEEKGELEVDWWLTQTSKVHLFSFLLPHPPFFHSTILMIPTCTSKLTSCCSIQECSLLNVAHYIAPGFLVIDIFTIRRIWTKDSRKSNIPLSVLCTQVTQLDIWQLILFLLDPFVPSICLIVVNKNAYWQLRWDSQLENVTD